MAAIHSQDHHLNHKPLLIIFDSHNLVYKSYFAVPKLHDKHNRPTNAIQGTCSILLKFFQRYPNALFCMTSDSKGGNFRHEMYSEYKGHRKEIDDDLLEQIIVMPKFYEAFGLKIFAQQGFEADDFIASVAKKYENKYRIMVVSSDKDLMQLLCDGIEMMDPTKETDINHDFVVKKFGIEPSQLGDYLALIGDASDNVPGAKSVGPKTALKILKYGNLIDLVENPNLIKEDKLQKIIIENKDNIILSKKLVSLKDDLSVEVDESELKIDLKKQAKILHKLFGEYDINALQRRLDKFIDKEDKDNSIDNFHSSFDSESIEITKYKSSIDNTESVNILTNEIIQQIWEQGVLSITLSENKIKIYFNKKLYLIDEISLELKEIFESHSIKKITYDACNLEKWLLNKYYPEFNNESNNISNNEASITSLYDLSIIYYHLMGVKANDSLLDIMYYLGMDDEGRNIDYQKDNYIYFYEEIFQKGLNYIFKNKHIEFFEEDRKIYEILRKMERTGIYIDKNKLDELKEYFENKLEDVRDKVIDLTGYDFNILSPKQTSNVLFDKLGLEPTKKSKNEGVYSTSQDVLDELSMNGVEVAEHILQYRSLYKLKSSYCDSLAEQINPITHRIHTTFALNGATTGRILSSNPNLQNIPTRTTEAKKIGSCFIAKENYKLISVDYSQIELRILSAIADVKNLKTAFNHGEDIHRLTASQVFGISLNEVDDFWRSKAKAVNFGIIYGISPFGLSKQLKISTNEADGIIKNYLKCYGEIENYLEKTKAFANQYGYVKTMFGRNCYLSSSRLDRKMNFHEKSFFERAAINAPIQGTASDIIKFAMINVDDYIKQNNIKANILLQIHDELILEIHQDCIEMTSKNIIRIMENIGEKINLKLKVDCNISDGWDS